MTSARFLACCLVCVVFSGASGCAPLPPPRLNDSDVVISAGDIAHAGDEAAIDWAVDEDDTTFEIQLSDVSDFSAGIVSLGSSQPRVNLATPFRQGKITLGKRYHYRVRQIAPGEEPSAWSQTGQLQLEEFAQPVVGEARVHSSKQTAVVWAAVDRARAYRFQLLPASEAARGDVAFDDARVFLVDQRVTDPRIDLLPFLQDPEFPIAFGVPYPFRVSVSDPIVGGDRRGGRALSPWSEVRNLTFVKPRVPEVEDLVAERLTSSVRLSWTPVVGAVSYALEIFESEQSTNPLLVIRNLTETNLDLAPLKKRAGFKFGHEYRYRIQCYLSDMPLRPFSSEARLLKIDIQAPSPRFPAGDIDSDQLPDFRWSVPDFDGVSFEVWLGTSPDSDASWKLFETEVGAGGIDWSEEDYRSAFDAFYGGTSPRSLSPAQPELLEFGKLYCWRVRSVTKTKRRRVAGAWSAPVKFRVHPKAPTATDTQEETLQRLTPRVTFDLQSWARMRALVEHLLVQVAPAGEEYSGRPEDSVLISPDELKQGVNQIRLPKRLRPGVRYKLRVRTIYKAGDRKSRWVALGIKVIPPNPREQFPTGLVAKTEDMQEWWPSLSPDFTQLAYQSGIPSEHSPAYADSIDRSKEGTELPGSIFIKELRHDERGMPVPTQSRGAFAESVERRRIMTHFLQPSWSPDGRRLFFGSNQHDAYGHLRLSVLSRTLEAPAVTEVLSAQTLETLLYPDVRRDGQAICFTRGKITDRAKIEAIEEWTGPRQGPSWDAARDALDAATTMEIWTSSVDGGKKTYVTDGKLGSFSPDGTKIAYLSRSAESQPWSIWVCHAKGGGEQQLVAPPPGSDARLNSPRWSNDGRKIAYTSNEAGNDDIWIVDVSSGKQIQATGLLAEDRCPTWGRDDKYIVFVSDREEQFDLWYVDVSSAR